MGIRKSKFRRKAEDELTPEEQKYVFSFTDKIIEDSIKELHVTEVLTNTQKIAIESIWTDSMRKSEQSITKLQVKFKKLGYKTLDLEICLRYIKYEAPIIIHFHFDDVKKFIKDTHYRNLFETNTSHGSTSKSARICWEDKLFNKIYHYSEGAERVKYGCLNFTNSRKGVKSARQYGDCYFILKQHVRKRSSIARGDTSNKNDILGCCDYYAHMLLDYKDEEIKALVSVATKKSKEVHLPEKFMYKECQIHGPIRFNRDILAAVVPQKKYNHPLIREFCAKNNIELRKM